MSERAWSRRNERWLVTETGQWRAFEPLWLLSWIHTVAQQAGVVDPFTIQELAISVWEMLQQDWPEHTPLAVTELQQRVAKLVRALGRPSWAELLGRLPATVMGLHGKPSPAAERLNFTGQMMSPAASRGYDWRAWQRQAEARLAEEMLTQFLPEPLAELHRQGCLVWHGIEHPWELAAAQVRWLPVVERGIAFPEGRVPTAQGPALSASISVSAADSPRVWSGISRGIFEHFEALRCWVGQSVWVCGPEFELAQARVRIGEVPALVRELMMSARYTGLKLVLHTNVAAEHISSDQELELFSGNLAGDWKNRFMSVRATLLEALLAWLDREDVELVWEMTGPAALAEDWRSWRQFLLAVASGKVSLAWSGNRRNAGRLVLAKAGAILTVVGLHAGQLAQQYEIGESELLVRRLTNLVQLATWGIRQWRERLRECLGRLAPPFLAEWAPVAVYVTGLGQLSAAWFASVLEGWQWMRQALQLVRNTLQANLRDTGAGSLLVAPSRFWWLGSMAVGAATPNASENTWRVTSEEDLARLRAWWRVCARCYDDLEVTWVVPGAVLRSPQDFQAALRVWRRLPGLRRLRLLPHTAEQSELFSM